MKSRDRGKDRVRRGFSFMEIAVALAIIAILTAVLVPGLALRMRSSQAASIIEDIRVLSNAIQQYRENVGRYPSSLTQLVTRPTGQNDLCSVPLPTNNVARWRGPYVAQDAVTGFQSGDAIFDLPLPRTPSSTAPTFTNLDGELRLKVTRVDSVAAEAVEVAFDGYTNDAFRYSTGTVLINIDAGGGGFSRTGTVQFRIPVRGC